MAEKSNHTFQMRVHTSWLAMIDEWRRKQPDLPTRAEAIRRLVDKGISADAESA
ncbi:hypothetical protein [Sphingomonas sp.]|uniref:hypothetical protein n=1 Tax=Sphingomonas sp. TaxID=28214 RepID=UPI003F6F37D5